MCFFHALSYSRLVNPEYKTKIEVLFIMEVNGSCSFHVHQIS